MSDKKDPTYYAIEGVLNKSAIRIYPMGYEKDVMQDGRVQDTLLAHQVIRDNIGVAVFACLLKDSKLMASKKQPIIYANIFQDRKLSPVSLMKIYLCFEITCEIYSSKQLLTNELTGKFTIEMNSENTWVTLDDNIKSFSGNKETIEYLVDFIKTDEINEIIKELIEAENEKRREKFKQEYGQYQIPKKSIDLKNYFM